MSKCNCEQPKKLRFTGEVLSAQTEDVQVRLRCSACGGKITYVDAAWMAEINGLELDDLKNGRCLGANQQIHITIDLV